MDLGRLVEMRGVKHTPKVRSIHSLELHKLSVGTVALGWSQEDEMRLAFA